MIINLTIPDNLYQHYFEKYGAPILYKKMKEAIENFKDLDKSDRFFLVNGEYRKKLEAIFDTTITDQADLVKKCEKLNNVRIGNIGITFTTDELARFKAQASYHNKDMEQFMLEVANQIKEYMLDKA